MAQQQLQPQHQQQGQSQLPQQPMLPHAPQQQAAGPPGQIIHQGSYFMPMPMHVQYGHHPMFVQPPYMVPYGYAPPQQQHHHPRPPPGMMVAMAHMGSQGGEQLSPMMYAQPGRAVPVLGRHFGPPPDSPGGGALGRPHLSGPPAPGGWVLGSPLPSGELRSASAGQVHLCRAGSPSLSGGSGDGAGGGGEGPASDRVAPLPHPRVAPQPLLIPMAAGAAPQSRAAPAHDSVRVASDGGSTALIGSSLPSLISSGSPSLASFSEDFAERGTHPWTRMSAEPSRPTCAFYLKTGTCAYGDKCKFSHPSDRVPHVQLNSLGLPVRPGETECAYYIKNMRCGFGASCKFHHPELAVGWVPSGTGPMGHPGAMIPMMPGMTHGMMPAGPLPHAMVMPHMLPQQQSARGPLMYPGHYPMGVNVRPPMVLPGSPMPYSEGGGGGSAGSVEGGGSRRSASFNLGSRAGSIDLEASQAALSNLAHSRSGSSRSRTRRPARMAALPAASPSAAPSANHIPGSDPALGSGQPVPPQAAAAKVPAPSLSPSVRVLASPFANVAAPDASSEVGDAVSGDSPQAFAAAPAAAPDDVSRAAVHPVAASVQGRAASTPPTTKARAASTPPTTKARAASGARPDQDYAIVEAPLSLRRRGSMPPPPEQAASQHPPQGSATASTAGSGGGGGTSEAQQLSQLPRGREGLKDSQHTPSVAPQPAAESVLRTDSCEHPPRGTPAGGEGPPGLPSTAGAADIVTNLGWLHMSGACSGIGGDRIETASSTPVSFTSAASS